MKSAALTCSVVLISLCVALSLCEVLVRVFDPHVRDSVIPGGFFMVDDDLGWRLRPGTRARHHTRYFDVEYTTIASGFRDRPRALWPAPATQRIVLYGDSLVFGWGVPEGKRFSDLVEHQGQNLEVWNHAVPGYGLDQEILAY